MVNVLESTLEWGYSKILHKFPYTMFFFGFGLSVRTQPEPKFVNPLRSRFLGIYSWTPLTFTNSGSGICGWWSIKVPGYPSASLFILSYLRAYIFRVFLRKKYTKKQSTWTIETSQHNWAAIILSEYYRGIMRTKQSKRKKTRAGALKTLSTISLLSHPSPYLATLLLN